MMRAVDATMAYDLNEQLTLRLNGFNLFDKRYANQAAAATSFRVRDVRFWRRWHFGVRPLVQCSSPFPPSSARRRSPMRWGRWREEWIDGKATAGAQSALAKSNLQLVQRQVAAGIGADILNALKQNALFLSAALPRAIFPPLFNRYDASQGHGLATMSTMPSASFRMEEGGSGRTCRQRSSCRSRRIMGR